MADTQTTTMIGWAILELMGHRRLAGYVTEETIAGHGFLRLDVYEGEAVLEDLHLEPPAASQFYSPSAVYYITPTTQEVARAATRRPEPVARWELAAPRDEEPADAELAEDAF